MTQLSKQYTAQEYLDIEGRSKSRHEYFGGKVFAMEDSTLNHNEIVDNVRSILKRLFRSKGCRVFAETVKVEVCGVHYHYPDVIVTCAPSDISGTCLVKHPSVLVEVSSKSSTGDDRGIKLRQYMTIASLQYYLLVSQDEYYVELFSRTEQGDIWAFQNFENESDVVRFEQWDFEMSLKAIYDHITFVPDEVI